jgi:hypothetical protein
MQGIDAASRTLLRRVEMTSLERMLDFHPVFDSHGTSPIDPVGRGGPDVKADRGGGQ